MNQGIKEQNQVEKDSINKEKMFMIPNEDGLEEYFQLSVEDGKVVLTDSQGVKTNGVVSANNITRSGVLECYSFLNIQINFNDFRIIKP